MEVELPALQSFAPLEFVDTPGLGSAFTHNTEATLHWLPNVGAALVAVSADAPLSERDLNLLEHAPPHAQDCAAADEGGFADGSRSGPKSRVPAAATPRANGATGCRSSSTRCGRKKTVLKWNSRIFLSPLIRNRGEAAEQILRHKLTSLISQALRFLRVALAAATQAEIRRQALYDRLVEERGHFDALREELHLLAHDCRPGAGTICATPCSRSSDAASQSHRRFGGAVAAMAAALAAAAGSLARLAD